MLFDVTFDIADMFKQILNLHKTIDVVKIIDTLVYGLCVIPPLSDLHFLIASCPKILL